MRYRALVISWLAAGALALVMGCSDDDKDSSPTGSTTPPSTVNIGPQGGVIPVGAAMNLVVPPGALTDTVTFSASRNTSPPACPSGQVLVSTCYSIEPTGTQFSQDATLSITYDTTRLMGAAESGIKLYSYYSGGWHELNTTVTPAFNLATATVSHLCEFAAFADTASEAEGVFAALVVARHIADFGYLMITDMIEARFDAAYAPCEPQTPLQVDSIKCNEFRLDWNSVVQAYGYYPTVPWPPDGSFLEHGTSYQFVVDGTPTVPDLTESIVFPQCSPVITSPEYMATESLSGFTVTWGNFCNGNITFVFMHEDDSVGTVITTANDGSYTFTAAQLASLEPGTYSLVMTFMNTRSITTEGYDPRSFVWARVMSTAVFYLE